MSIWAIILMLVALTVFFIILLIFILRVRGDTKNIIDGLGTSKQKRIHQETQIEKDAKENIKEHYLKLKEEQAKIEKWYDKQKIVIDKEALDEFNKLISDQKYLDHKLDNLLGLNTSETNSTGDKEKGSDSTEDKQAKDQKGS